MKVMILHRGDERLTDEDHDIIYRNGPVKPEEWPSGTGPPNDDHILDYP